MEVGLKTSSCRQSTQDNGAGRRRSSRARVRFCGAPSSDAHFCFLNHHTGSVSSKRVSYSDEAGAEKFSTNCPLGSLVSHRSSNKHSRQHQKLISGEMKRFVGGGVLLGPRHTRGPQIGGRGHYFIQGCVCVRYALINLAQVPLSKAQVPECY